MAITHAGILEDVATIRIDRLIDSRELDGKLPTDPEFQRICDDYIFGRK